MKTEHHNPFEVLELPASASGREITRQKDKLLGMLELGLERAKRYTSSVGDRERTADLVRSAAQELERPRSRLGWELWVQPSDADVDADPDAALMRRALVLHRQLSKDTAFGVEELDELGGAWDAVLASDGLYERISSRADELEIEIVEGEVYDEFRDEIRNQLRTMFEQGPVVDLDKLDSEIAAEVAHEFSDKKVELLELACSRISKHKLQQKQRREQWNGLVREYATAVAGRGDQLRRAAFQVMNVGISDLAVELFNDNIDHSTALSMFQWLRDEAENLEDSDAHALHANNASTVQSRIFSDNEASYPQFQSPPVQTDSAWGAGRILMIAVGLVLALIRAGNGCSSSKSYDVPTFSRPRSFEIPPDLYKDLHRLESLRRDPADFGLDEGGLEHESVHAEGAR